MKSLRFFLCVTLLTTSAFAQITFSKASYTPFSGSVAVGDFDRDGRPDVASLTFLTGGDGALVIYRGIAGGLSKKAQYDIPSAADASAIYTADLNVDGKLDILFVKPNTPELEIWFGNGDATFRFGETVTSGATDAAGLGDLNSDGYTDMVTCERGDTHSGSEIFLNNGSGGFTNAGFVEAPRFVINCALADFNRDGILDILFRTVDQLVMFKGNADGTFSAGPTTSFTVAVGSMVVGSFTSANNADIAYRVPRCSTCATDTIYIYTNDGTGRFALKSTNHVGLSQDRINTMAAGDLNNDMLQDLVFANNGQTGTAMDQSIVYILNKGGGTFGSQTKAASMPGTTFLPVLRHFSLDSMMDIIAPSKSVVLLFSQNAPTNCTPPGTAVLATRICSPGNNVTISRTFTVRASGDSPAGVKRMELWLDGKKVFEFLGDQLKRTITVAAGTHRVTVQAYDLYHEVAKKTVTVTAK